MTRKDAVRGGMRCFIVDTFTEVPLTGNPAAVCLAEPTLDAGLMTAIAREFNLSETAFVVPNGGTGEYPIRYFSPKQEIPLCGHATLASAKILFEEQGVDRVQFRTTAGLALVVEKTPGGIRMDLPAYDLMDAPVPPALTRALGLERVRNAKFNVETKILMLEIESAVSLRDLEPDFQSLVASHDSINGVVVTASSGDDGYDFHSRYFWPWSGTSEDPVTGGTHTFLAKYWAPRLGKAHMRAFQSSRRTGSMDVELAGEQVRITGGAVTVFEGWLRIPLLP